MVEQELSRARFNPIRFLLNLPARYARVTSGGSYVPQIDGLRFLAIMPVLFFHAALRAVRIYPDITPGEQDIARWFPAGHLGVALFFFVSGYIIAYPFFSGRTPSLKKFYTRRLFRLEPPYIVAMVGCFFVLSIGFTPTDAPNFHATQAPLWQSLLASLFYGHSFIFGEHPRLNPPTWSLEREVQFYLIAPFLVLAYLRIKTPRIRLAFGAVVCVAALVLGEVIEHHFAREVPIRNSLLAESYGFLLGVLVSDYSSRARPFEMPAAWGFDVALALGYAGLLFTGAVERGLPLYPALANTSLRAICVLMIFFGAARGKLGRSLLGLPWVALIGGACYSIYLVHVPVMQAGMQIVAHFVHPGSLIQSWAISFTLLIPLSIAVGLVFYILIERPCMRPDWPRRLMDALIRIRKGRTLNRPQFDEQ
jgi:peptidoglycan/LPS O-acetylase OafA/YrhL